MVSIAPSQYNLYLEIERVLDHGEGNLLVQVRVDGGDASGTPVKVVGRHEHVGHSVVHVLIVLTEVADRAGRV